MIFDKFKYADCDGCLPCTLGVIGNIEKHRGEFQEKGNKQVEILARLTGLKRNVFSVELELDDTTGKVVALLYFIKESKKYYGASRSLTLVEGFYYNIFGVLRFSEQLVSIAISKIDWVNSRLIINEFLSRAILNMIKIKGAEANENEE